jgi:hypothetical protein
MPDGVSIAQPLVQDATQLTGIDHGLRSGDLPFGDRPVVVIEQ